MGLGSSLAVQTIAQQFARLEKRHFFILDLYRFAGARVAAQTGITRLNRKRAKAPKDAILPGGNGLSFDWRLVAQRRWLRPWMLAGGLTVQNVAEAVRLTNVRQVDVASGVESTPGIKDPAKTAAFIAAAG